ncbi:asparaginase [Acetobacteraceae bacterium H6797]|nr:asparaginase [Acetobacteraceae bacterium H6797]
MSKPKIAFIGTGGTISSLGAGPLDTVDYGATNNRIPADEILARFPEVHLVADVVAVPYKAVVSTQIFLPEWKDLVALCSKLQAEHPDLKGIVIGHGTSALAETAYMLSLTLKTDLPVVLVGSQRPASALSTDAGLNLVNAFRVAAAPEARGMGVLVVLNDEIHAAREVDKVSNGRMQTFQTADFGALGHADGDKVSFYRKPLRKAYPETEFDIASLEALPRVDILYAYTGADATAAEALIAAGAKGIVSAGFAPGFAAAGEVPALVEAVKKGVVVVQSSRARGRVPETTKLRQAGIIPADNLLPEKARILLTLALTKSSDPAEIKRIFATY